MNINSVIEDLSNEFEPEEGFIGRLRNERVFDLEKANRYLLNLSYLEVQDSISLELAKLIWSLPVVLQWQFERAESGSELQKQLKYVLDQTVNIFGDLIGYP